MISTTTFSRIAAALFVAVALYPASSFAQHRRDAALPSFINVPNTAEKGAGVGSRLLATSEYGHNATTGQDVLNDTAVYGYSSPSSLLISTEAHSANEMYDYAYDASGYLLSTTGHTAAGVAVKRDLYVNNAAGFILTHTFQNWYAASNTWGSTFRYQYARDANNRVTSYVHQAWNGNNSTWQNEEQDLFTLNAQGNITVDTYQVWDGTIASWVSNEVTHSSYNATGNIRQTDTLFTASTTAPYLTPYDLTKYINNTAGTPDTAFRYSWTNSAWSYYGRRLYSYNTAGLQTNLTYQFYDAAIKADTNSLETNTAYNSFNQMTRSEFLLWKSGAWAPRLLDDYLYHYYYQPYSTSVTNTAATAPSFQVAPVPASNLLTITAGWAAQQAAELRLTDLAGHLLRVIMLPPATMVRYDISLTDLPAGNYVISLKGSNGGSAARIITVAR